MAREKQTDEGFVAAQVEKSKQPSDLYADFAAWILENTGVKVSAAHLQLGGRLYMTFQKQNRDSGTGRSRAAVAAKPVAEKVVKAPAKKAPAKPAAKAEVATPNKRIPAKAPAAKPAAKPRRGKVAAAEEAPY